MIIEKIPDRECDVSHSLSEGDGAAVSRHVPALLAVRVVLRTYPFRGHRGRSRGLAALVHPITQPLADRRS
jgi:hypothetical protein